MKRINSESGSSTSLTSVASLNLCRELFAGSGWDGTALNHFSFHDGRETVEASPLFGYISAKGTPAYDLGYLLRRLPPATAIRKRKSKEYSAFAPVLKGVLSVDNSPENAAARLAAQLIEHGILPKAGDCR